jgi:hypothetical protein
MFKTDYGRSSIVNPCPTCPPIKPVAKTGQTTCYDESNNIIDCAGTGQDGEYQNGYVRFTDNGNGTVTDNLTRLIWTKNANCFASPRTWYQALSGCNVLASGTCGLTDDSSAGDWRLPNANELRTILTESDFHETSLGVMPVGHPFTGIQAAPYNYWSSTTVATNYIYAIVYNVGTKQITYDGKSVSDYTWCVRGGH